MTMGNTFGTAVKYDPPYPSASDVARLVLKRTARRFSVALPSLSRSDWSPRAVRFATSPHMARDP